MTYEVLSSLPPGTIRDGSRTRLARVGYKLVALRTIEPDGGTFEPTSAHPSVLPLIEVASIDGQPVAVYGYVAGVTLREIVEAYRQQSKTIPLDLIARVMLDAARALGAVTATHWHNGISDAALLVGFDGVTRVLDYGAPRSSGRFGTRTPLPGAPRDVFTFGAVLHSALSGYTGAYTGLSEPIEPPSKNHPDVTPGLDNVILTAISPALEQRQASMAQLATELEAVLAGPALDLHGVSALLKRLFRDRVTELIRATSTPHATKPSVPTPAAANPYGSVADEPEPATEMVRAPPGMADEPPTYVGSSPPKRVEVKTAPGLVPKEVAVPSSSVFVDEASPAKHIEVTTEPPTAIIGQVALVPQKIDLSTQSGYRPKPRPYGSAQPASAPSGPERRSVETDEPLEASLDAFSASPGDAPPRLDENTNPGIKPKALSVIVDESPRENTNPGIVPRDLAGTERTPNALLEDRSSLEAPAREPRALGDDTGMNAALAIDVRAPPRRDAALDRTQTEAAAAAAPRLLPEPSLEEDAAGETASRLPLVVMVVALVAAVVAIAFAMQHLMSSEPESVTMLPLEPPPVVLGVAEALALEPVDAGVPLADAGADETEEDEDDAIAPEPPEPAPPPAKKRPKKKKRAR